MTAEEAETILDLLEGSLARAEQRLTTMVNERSTNVISATTAIVSGLHDDQQSLTEAMASLADHLTAAVGALRQDLVERRRYIDERLALVEGQVRTLADLVPGGAEALGETPLRQVVEAQHAAAEAARAELWTAVVHVRTGLVILAALLLLLVVALSRGWL